MRGGRISDTKRKLLAHIMAVQVIPSGTKDGVGAFVSFAKSGSYTAEYDRAVAWLAEAWKVMQTAKPSCPYTNEEEFYADLLQKVEERKNEQTRSSKAN